MSKMLKMMILCGLFLMCGKVYGQYSPGSTIPPQQYSQYGNSTIPSLPPEFRNGVKETWQNEHTIRPIREWENYPNYQNYSNSYHSPQYSNSWYTIPQYQNYCRPSYSQPYYCPQYYSPSCPQTYYYPQTYDCYRQKNSIIPYVFGGN
jgi:hypothetical protein